MPAAKKKSVDVRSPADRKALKDVIEQHPITIILVHADWCGHCKDYKQNVWSKLEELPEKKNGLAAIHHDQLEGTEFADAKLKGFPSVIVVGKKKMAEFEDEDGVTNAIPTDQANNLEKMQTIVSSAEPSTLTGTLKNMKTNVDGASKERESPELSQEAEASRELKGYTNVKSRNGAKSVPTLAIPDPTKDTLDTQGPVDSQVTEFEANKQKQAGGSGSLYESLLAATRAAAPAAALVATAVALKRRSRSRKTKRSKRRRSNRTARR